MARSPRLSRAALAALLLAVAAPAFGEPPKRGERRKKEEAEGPTRGLRFPSLAPDGKTVVFAWRGDVWRAPADGGGPAVRLTIHEEQDTKPRVSPDGRHVAFTSKRAGSYDVYVTSIDGGEPRQVTFHSATDVATDWSPDGRRILFLSSREPGPGGGVDLYEVEATGGTARRVTRDGGRDGAYSPDGSHVVYTRGFNTVFQDAYQGSANYDLYVVPTSGGTPRRLTRSGANELNPAFSADGSTVYYLAGSKGRLNFFAAPAAEGAGEPRAVTSFEDDDVRRPTLAWDRRTAVYEKDGYLWRLDLSAEEPEPVRLDVRVESDVRNAGIDVRTVTEGGEHAHVSPDGSSIAFSLRGDLWILPASGGEGEQVTRGPGTDEWPRWSPDGKRIAYASNARGNSDLYVLDLATKQSKQVTTHPKDDFFHAWSPDGTRLVFSSERTGNRDLFTIEVESGTETQLTRDPAADDDPAYSPDGKWIAFDSGRGGAQAIWVMPAGGGEAQARRLSQGTGQFQVPVWSPDGSMIVFEEFDPTSASPGGLWAMRSSGGPSVQVSRDGQTASWTKDWIYFTAERRGERGIFRVRPPSAIEAGERVPFLGRMRVDRRREHGDLFDEAWQRLKDGFYDAKMHGADWDALKKKYRPLAVDAEVKEEFYNVVSQMLGELNASHLGIYGGRDEDGGEPAEATGYLGLELEATQAEGGGRRVASVQEKGPAFDAHVRVGDVLVSVNGTALDAGVDVDKVLAGTAGKDVKVVYRPGDGSAERTETVKAASASALGRVRYSLWNARNEERVAERTKKEAGYLHLTQMDPSNLAKFNAAVGEMNKAKKKGLVLDVRNNGGGNIHQQLLDVLAKKPYIAFQSRGSAERQVQPSLYWGKPVVLLINERSFSDAEVFPHAFKTLGLGKVVGVPTAGGVIGTTDVTLSDGSRFRIPRVGWYGLDGVNLERLGVAPDVLVEETSEDRLAGRDPQLEKAIDLLLEEMAAAAPAAAAKPEPEVAPEPAPAEPAPEAAAKPDATTPVAGSDERPLDDAVEGEWAEYAVSIPDAAKALTLRTATVAADSVTVTGEPAELVTLLGFPATTARRPLAELLQGVAEVWGAKGEIAAPAREEVSFSSFTGSVLVFSLKDAEGRALRLEFSNRVPVFGLVRAQRDGQTVLEVKGFEGKPAPAPARGG
jgi:tricorn protease